MDSSKYMYVPETDDMVASRDVVLDKTSIGGVPIRPSRCEGPPLLGDLSDTWLPIPTSAMQQIHAKEILALEEPMEIFRNVVNDVVHDQHVPNVVEIMEAQQYKAPPAWIRQTVKE